MANEVQKALAELTDGQRWILLSFLAQEYPQIVVLGLNRVPHNPARPVVPGVVIESRYHDPAEQEKTECPGGS